MKYRDIVKDFIVADINQEIIKARSKFPNSKVNSMTKEEVLN